MSIVRQGKQWILIAGLTSMAALTVLLLAKGPDFLGKSTVIQEESALVGNWSGESICQDRNSSCHDEKNVYHISKAKKAGFLTISTDKIVDGKTVNMGNIEFKYDREKKLLTSENERSIWRFVVNGNAMEGTLTLITGNKLFRKVTLHKEQRSLPSHGEI